MTKRMLFVCLIVAGVVVVVMAFAIVASRQKPIATAWTIESPNHTYRITFTGSSGSSLWPFTESQELKNRRIKADIAKEGRLFVQSAIIYEGGAYDFTFKRLYPDSEWLSEKVLNLWDKSEAENPRAITSSIFLSNESKQPLRYAYVHAGKTNLFLLFDIAPEGRITLPVRLQHWEEVIGCEGKYDDSDLPYGSGDFSLAVPGKTGTRYDLRFDARKCLVTRAE